MSQHQPVPTPIVVARRVAGSIFILSLAAVLVGIALLVSWYVTQPIEVTAPPAGGGSGGGAGGGSGGGTSTSPAPRSTPTTPPRPKSKAQLEREAVAELERLAAEDLAATYVSGQWVAQVSSKYIGVKDARQRTRSGSHTFRAVDILHEHRALRKRFTARHEVRLLRGEDFYPYKTKDGKTFWYTFVLSDFSSEAQVERFCARAYPTVEGEALENRCLPRELGA